MNRKNLVLGVILVFLIALAYVYQGPFKDWQTGLGKPKNILAGLNVEQIDTIEIASFNQVTVLEKTGDKWKIAGTKEFYADQAAVDNALRAFGEAAAAEAELVSENPDMKDQFSTGGSGVRVAFRQSGDTLFEVVIGNPGPDFSSAYIAEPDSDKTFLVKANLSSAFTRPEWHDRAIFSIDREAITVIRFQYPNREFRVEKQDDTWRGVAPFVFTVSEDKIEPILAIMADLSAAQIPPQTFDGTGLENNSIIVQAQGDGIDQTLMVGGRHDSGFYFAKRGDSDNIYLITEEQKEELNKRYTDLR